VAHGSYVPPIYRPPIPSPPESEEPPTVTVILRTQQPNT
jgi:hypothetical protein